MKTCQKKPLPMAEAVQWGGVNTAQIKETFSGRGVRFEQIGDDLLVIYHNETKYAKMGDWILCEEHGLPFHVTPFTFRLDYEWVEI